MRAVGAGREVFIPGMPGFMYAPPRCPAPHAHCPCTLCRERERHAWELRLFVARQDRDERERESARKDQEARMRRAEQDALKQKAHDAYVHIHGKSVRRRPR